MTINAIQNKTITSTQTSKIDNKVETVSDTNIFNQTKTFKTQGKPVIPPYPDGDGSADYKKKRADYYIKEFKEHGILTKAKPKEYKLFGYTIYSSKRDGYNVNVEKMETALGKKDLTLGDLKFYLGLPKGYIREKIGNLPGDMDTYLAKKYIDFIDSNAINGASKK